MRVFFSLVFVALLASVLVAFTKGQKPESCLQMLSDRGYDFTPLKRFQDGICEVANPIKLKATPTTNLQTPVVLNCPFAIKLGNWLQAIDAKSISHVGGYNCRNISGTKIPSQHSFGNAIDISRIDGISISQSWRKQSEIACFYFRNILTPDTNNAHAHHIHLDDGLGIPCWMTKLKNSFVQNR